jgi:hypothetical protein
MPCTSRVRGLTVSGAAFVLVLVGEGALRVVTVAVGSMPASATSTRVRAGLVEVLTTLATMSPVRSSRVTTWNTLAGGAGWS